LSKARKDIYLALRQTQGTLKADDPNWQPWVLFFLKALRQQKPKAGSKVGKRKIVEGAIT